MPIVEVSFRVDGAAATQGSMKTIPLKRHGKPIMNRHGNQVFNTVHSHQNTMPHRKRVSEAAAAAMSQLGLDGILMKSGVEVDAKFFFKRPNSHYRAGKNAHMLKASAPTEHFISPDTDKLQRLIGDALSGVVYEDDKQIWKWRDPTKTWISGEPYTLVKVIGYIPEVDLF